MIAINLFEELKIKALKDAVVNWNVTRLTADGEVSMILDAVTAAKDLVFPSAAFAIVMPEGEEFPRIKPCTHWKQGDEVLISIVITPDMAYYARAYDAIEHKVISMSAWTVSQLTKMSFVIGLENTMVTRV